MIAIVNSATILLNVSKAGFEIEPVGYYLLLI